MADQIDTHTSIETFFPDCGTLIARLRGSDSSFDEICSHFEIAHSELTKRIGRLDPATTDLIASFDDLRREIELRLGAESRAGRAHSTAWPASK